MVSIDRTSRLEALADPNRPAYQSVMSYLKMRKLQRSAEKKERARVVKMPHRVSGAELQSLEKEFGWKFEIVDRSPSMAPYADGKFFCLAEVNRTMKSWDGEEVIVFDGDFMTLVVKNEGWVHCCCTYATASKAASYELQLLALDKAVIGRRADISVSALEFKGQFQRGKGWKVCTDASQCQHIADTLLVDLPKVDVGAEQLARALIQHQAARAKVWFFFEADMFLEDEGVLTSMPGRYLIDRDADRVYIFPDGAMLPAFEYSFSSMMSYVLQSEVFVDGERFMIEVHDSMEGAKFVQLVKAAFVPPEDSSIDVHYFRNSGERLVVIEQKWFPPALGGDGLDGRQIPGRCVVPERIADKVVGRLLGSKEQNIRVDQARAAVRDIVAQDVTKGTTVIRPKHLPVDVAEQLAQYAQKRAVKERAEMIMEQKVMTARIKAARGKGGSWVNNLLGAYYACGDIAKAVADLPGKMLEGFTVENDYTFRAELLDPAYVVRNVIRATSGDNFGSRYVSFFPGGKPSTGSSVSSVSFMLYKARAARKMTQLREMRAAAFEETTVREHAGTDGYPSMSESRDELVEKMRDLYDAHDVSIGFREEVVVSVHDEPQTTQTAYLDDPVTAIMEDYRELLPALDEADLSVRTHLAATSDREENTTAALRVLNREYDVMPRDQHVRRSKLKTAGGGKRVITQQEAVVCFDKRVNNAPRIQWPTVMREEAKKQVDRFLEVCMKKNWHDIVAKRCSDGMWLSRTSELGKNVRKLDQSKVTTMLRETFSRGHMDMTSFVAMVKDIHKAKFSESAAYEHAPTQTIVYQKKKLDNSFSSSILSEVHDTIDEILEPNVRVNVRRDVDNNEKWFNSFRPRRETAGSACKSFEVDITQCDKSHTLFNWLVWLEFMTRLGMPEDLCDLWSVMMGKKTASAPMVGMLVEFFEQLTSGGFHTISFNSIVCGIAVVNAMNFDKQDIVTLQFVGDDSLIEIVRDVESKEALDLLQNLYNLEAKMKCSDVRYFCSRYYVEYDGYYFIMRDPGKLAESAGRHVSSVADVSELWTAYCDSTRNYDKEELIRILPFLVAEREQSRVIPTGLVRGLASLRLRDNFYDLYDTPVEVLSA